MPLEHVLLVEDEAIIGMALAAELEDCGFTVLDVCPTGKEALEVLRLQQVDLVILDIKLGDGMDGLQTLEEIRKIASPKVIVISGNSEPATAQRIAAAKVDGFLVKPVNPLELQLLLKELM